MSCVLLRSGLGSPTDIGVVREATGIKAFFIIVFPSSLFLLFIVGTLTLFLLVRLGYVARRDDERKW